jgi:SNF2 family DNA or RNA helicase
LKIARLTWLLQNPDGKASRNLRILRKSNKKLCVIGVTGTLMQNDHKELWNLIDLVMPDFLGTRAHFEAEVALPIKMAR